MDKVFRENGIRREETVYVSVIRTKGYYRLPFAKYYTGTAEGFEKRMARDYHYAKIQFWNKMKKKRELAKKKAEYLKHEQQ